MKRIIVAITAVAALSAGLAIAGAAKPDYKTIAGKVVNQSAIVREGERVVLRGDVRDIEFLEELNLAAMKAGADTLQIVEREQFAKRYFAEVPAKYDSQKRDLALRLVGIEQVEISIDGSEFPGQLKDIPATRMAAYSQSMAPVTEAKLKSGVRQVSIGNGLYPTAATAKRYGLTKDQLSKLFWDGLNVDYTKLQATGESVKAALAGKELKVVHANGTDLTVGIEARPVYVSDGVISADDVKQGGPSLQAWLPAGEVYLVPVAGTANGKVVYDTVPFADGEITALTLTFKNGKLASHTAKASPAYERWKQLYDAAAPGKDEFAVIDLGINPNVTVPAKSKLTTWVPAGTITLGIGEDTWAGGTNAVSFGAYGSINGATVTVDGKTIIEKGALKVQSTGS